MIHLKELSVGHLINILPGVRIIKFFLQLLADIANKSLKCSMLPAWSRRIWLL